MKINEIECKPFTTFKTFQTPTYESVLGDLDASTLDDRFNKLYGERAVFNSMINDGKLDEAGLLGIWISHANKWSKYRAILGLDYDPLKPYQSTTTRDRTYDTSGDSTTESNGNDSVYGFDSETGVNDSSNSNKSTNNNSRKDVTAETTTVTGNHTGTAPADLITKELRLRRTSLIDTILTDVRDELTLAIYD